MKRPSGENFGTSSLKGVCRKGIGFLSPTTGSTHRSNFVLRLALVNAIYCPSLDQSLGHFLSSVFRISSSLAAPLVGFSYRFPKPFWSDTKTMLDPSGDQMGKKSSAGLKVKRIDVVRTGSTIQMSRSPICESLTETATRFSSGERERLLYSVGSPVEFNNLPVRSNQLRFALPMPPPPYTSTPLSETE